MKDDVNLLDIVQTALASFDHRQPYSPGMFEPLEPLFRKLGYASAAVYIADDYPDRMALAAGYGGERWFPALVLKNRRKTLHDAIRAAVGPVPGLLTAPLFSHDRELGALAVTAADSRGQKTREAFDVLARSLSVMAYIERVRTNGKREREERDLFFAQSLTNRLLVRRAPRHRELRLGFEFVRSLEAGGDFFDFIPKPDGNLIGYIGSCSGRGLRTVLEVAGIMREINHACACLSDAADPLKRANHLLVKEMRRAHQASLALFHVDVRARKLRIAKSGRLGLMLCGPGAAVEDISATGAPFLGMVDKPEFHEEEFDFVPGQALFCVTEGFYSARDLLGARPQIHWFLEALGATAAAKPDIPLANAVFDSVNREHDHTSRTDEPMLAVSVEFTGRRDSIRARRDTVRMTRDTVRIRRDSTRLRQSERLRR